MNAQSIHVPAPYKGLTLRSGNKEINVHDVSDGTVYYGQYIDGNDFPVALHRTSEAEWAECSAKAVLDGASVYSMVKP